MVGILYDDQRVAFGPFVGDVPRRRGGAVTAADTQAGPLAQRVQREAAMFADDPAVGGLDRAGG